MKKHPYYLVFFLTGMLIMLLIQQYVPLREDTKSSGFIAENEGGSSADLTSEKKKDFSRKVNQVAHAVPIPDSLDFADENVPLNVPDVRQRLDRELLINTYWHSNTIQLLKLGAKYFPTIEEILRTYDVPQDFKYLVLAESGLRNVISPSNAEGYWQFLKPTAREYGLVVNDQVDERYHLERSTIAACKYLKDAREKFGTWTLAAASYNVGKERLQKELEKQKAESYYELYLNRETARYMFRILALKEVFQEPKSYGFFLKEEDYYPEQNFRTVKTDTSIDDLARFAKKQNTSYKQLKLLNPWLKGRALTNMKSEEYVLKLPR